MSKTLNQETEAFVRDFVGAGGTAADRKLVESVAIVKMYDLIRRWHAHLTEMESLAPAGPIDEHSRIPFLSRELCPISYTLVYLLVLLVRAYRSRPTGRQAARGFFSLAAIARVASFLPGSASSIAAARSSARASIISSISSSNALRKLAILFSRARRSSPSSCLEQFRRYATKRRSLSSAVPGGLPITLLSPQLYETPAAPKILQYESISTNGLLVLEAGVA
jgi:hypothetical protein